MTSLGTVGDRRVHVLIGSPFEAEYVARVRAVDPRLHVVHRPDLLGRPRYHADHTGAPFTRTPEQAAEWDALLAETEVLFDFDRQTMHELPAKAPRLRWIQATSAGVGQLVWRLGLDRTDIIVTTASGIHATPLAEWVVFSMLWFAKDAPRLVADQRAHRWERFCAWELPGATLGLVGLGRIGSEVARLAKVLGMRVVALRRRGGAELPWGTVDALYPRERLDELLREADYLVLVVPHTPETERMLDRRRLGLLKPNCVLINIGRGQLVDEAALIEVLREGRIRGASLDVFETEPLPAASPLWDMPNVLINPHSASTSYRENERICELFCDNLRRYLAGEPLRNVLDKTLGY